MASTRLIATCLILLCAFLDVSVGQAPPTIPSEDAFRPSRYDSVHEILFLGAAILRPDGRSIRAYGINGERRGSDINLFKDFPGAQKAVIDGLTGGPDGKTVISAVLNFGNDKLQHVILTYGSSAALQEVWDTEPYYHEAIATDDAGNVFALGSRLDDGGVAAPYPLLVEYDPTGRVLAKSLPSNLFKHGSNAIVGRGILWDPVLTIQDNHLMIFAPLENEVLVCSKQGAILLRLPLGPIIQGVTAGQKVQSIAIRNVVFLAEHRAVLDLIGYFGGLKAAIHSLVLVDIETGDYKVQLSTTSPTWMAFGGSEDKVLLLSHDTREAETIKPFKVSF